jgi:hypothetical protein
VRIPLLPRVVVMVVKPKRARTPAALTAVSSWRDKPPREASADNNNGKSSVSWPTGTTPGPMGGVSVLPRMTSGAPTYSDFRSGGKLPCTDT